MSLLTERLGAPGGPRLWGGPSPPLGVPLGLCVHTRWPSALWRLYPASPRPPHFHTSPASQALACGRLSQPPLLVTSLQAGGTRRPEPPARQPGPERPRAGTRPCGSRPLPSAQGTHFPTGPSAPPPARTLLLSHQPLPAELRNPVFTDLRPGPPGGLKQRGPGGTDPLSPAGEPTHTRAMGRHSARSAGTPGSCVIRPEYLSI